MPLYDIRCERGHVSERRIPLANYSDPIECACGAVASRVISTPRFSVDNTGYHCPVTEKWVGSRREHRENLKQTGCRVLETGEKEAAAKRRADDDAKLDRMIEDTVEKEIEAYSSDKKEQLHNELVNGGLDISVDRK